MKKGLAGKLWRLSEVLNIFLMFEIFLVFSRDTSHSQFGVQNQILVSCGSRDTANFRP
jgi:hypothetical protein